MASFILLPDSKQVINLDQIAGLSLDMEGPDDVEFFLHVHLAGDSEPMVYSFEDANIILDAVGDQMGLSGDDLTAKLKLAEADFEDDDDD